MCESKLYYEVFTKRPKRIGFKENMGPELEGNLSSGIYQAYIIYIFIYGKYIYMCVCVIGQIWLEVSSTNVDLADNCVFKEHWPIPQHWFLCSEVHRFRH